MKILFMEISDHLVNGRSLPPNMVSDYQSDMLLHGLKELYGSDVLELPNHWWMYADEKERRLDDFKKIWGKGFTIYGLLSNDVRSSIVNSDKCEKCILTIHHTMVNQRISIMKTIAKALEVFNGKDIAIIDGWDRPDIDDGILNYCRSNKIKYFKREMYNDIEGVYPISFAFPAEKILPRFELNKKKKYHIAPLIPVNQSIDPSYMSTYIYEDETSYYKMYQESYFALTSKKGGWDTLRHYEIIANGCVPIFVDIEKCPENCLFDFPKHLCIQAKFSEGLHLNLTKGNWELQKVLPHCGVVDMDNPGYISDDFDCLRHYYDILIPIHAWLENDGTTEALARYVLETMNED